MNPIAAGLSCGVLVSLLGLMVIWPSLGKGSLSVLTRITAVFLGKLAVLVALILTAHAMVGKEAAQAFSITLAGTVVVLLLAQAGLLGRRLGRMEKDAPGCEPDGRE